MTSAHYRKTYPISWDQLHRDAKALAWRLLDHDFYKGIVAITRGGLVPAAIIARELDVRLVDTVCVSSYAWKDQKGDVEVLKSIDHDGSGWLIIDDLVDTGRTAEVVRKMLPKAHLPPYTPNPPDDRWWIPLLPKSARTPGFCSPGIPNHSLSNPSFGQTQERA